MTVPGQIGNRAQIGAAVGGGKVLQIHLPDHLLKQNMGCLLGLGLKKLKEGSLHDQAKGKLKPG